MLIFFIVLVTQNEHKIFQINNASLLKKKIKGDRELNNLSFFLF
jgi:hypothetical protein